jgi:hypothetical protein
MQITINDYLFQFLVLGTQYNLIWGLKIGCTTIIYVYACKFYNDYYQSARSWTSHRLIVLSYNTHSLYVERFVCHVNNVYKNYKVWNFLVLYTFTIYTGLCSELVPPS